MENSEDIEINKLYSISGMLTTLLYDKKKKLDDARRANRELEQIQSNLAQVSELKDDLETKINEFTILDKLVNKEDTNYKQRRLGFLSEYIDENLNIIFPNDGFKTKINCDLTYNSPKVSLKLMNNLGRVSTPQIGEGKLCQQLISFSSSAAIAECMGLKSIYMDEAFTASSPENATKAGQLLKSLIAKGFQILLIEQNDDIYKDLTRREIVLKRDYIEKSVIVCEEKDY